MNKGEDEISLTSSIEEDHEPETEWELEGIIGDALLAEKAEDDQPWTIHKCLVLWTGFPLAEATWEPVENLPKETFAAWQEHKKRLEDDGGDVKASTREWVREQERKIWTRYKRHKLRNKIRREHGLSPKPWQVAGGQTPKDLSVEMRRYYLQEDASGLSSSEFETESIDFNRLDSPGELEAPAPRPSQSTVPTPDRVGSELSTTELSSTERDDSAKGKAKSASPNTSLTNPDCQQGPSLARKISNTKRPTHSIEHDSDRPRPLGVKRLNAVPSLPKTPEARRAQALGPVGNVFSGGKVRKQKTTLQEAAADPSRPAQHLNFRKQNLLYKASKNAEDRDPRRKPGTPDTSNPSLTGARTASDHRPPGAITEPAEGPPASNMDDTRTVFRKLRPGSLKSSAMNTQDTSNPVDVGIRPQLRNRKTVSFGEVKTAIFETMPDVPRDDEDESGLFIPETLNLTASESTLQCERPPTPPLGRKILSEPLTTLEKDCVIGSQVSKHINMVVRCLPQYDQSWLQQLRSCNRIEFTHWCKVNELRTQLLLLAQPQPLAKGTLSAPADPETLQIIRQKLLSTAESIICVTPNYMMTVFPPQYDEWDMEEFGFPKSDDPLRYVTWAPRSPDAGLTPGSFSLDDLATASRKEDDTESRSMPKGLARLVHLDCTAILPKTEANTSRVAVFLAFPSSAVAEARMMAHWISVSSGLECDFYDSFSKGDWISFLQEGRGIVVIHEDLLWKIRLFPKMASVLRDAANGLYTISVFDRALSTSVTSLWLGKSPTISNVCVRPAFQGGWVFHVCPTFFAAQPRQAYMFLKWFMYGYGQHGRRVGRLVVPAHLDEWLANLADERQRSPVEKEQAVAGADLANLHKALALVRELMQTYPREDAEDDSPHARSAFALVYAPAVIDPNDEQSLLNWFGWWSIANMDKFSRFFALCTTRNTHNLKRKIAPVRWQRGTMESYKNSEVSGHLSDFEGRRSAPSELAGEDSPEALRAYLQSVMDDEAYLGEAVLLDFNPVGYPNLQKVSELYDRSLGAFTDFATWFRQLQPITPQGIQVKAKRGVVKNTLCGLFLTPEGDWHTALKDTNNVLCRRPWFALFRPVEPHSRPWNSGAELLIWDPSYAGKVSFDGKFAEADLASIHRDFVRIIVEENGRRNPEVPLRKVWVGGWAKFESRYRDPLDIVLDRLANFVLQARKYVPAPKHTMLSRGWKLAEPSGAEHLKKAEMRDQVAFKGLTDNLGDAAQRDGESSSTHGKREPADAKVVFHAPRAHRARELSGTPNLFYKLTQDAAKQGRAIESRGVPTSEWYDLQRKDGSDFKHIVVADWETIFPELNIPPK